MEDRPVAPGPPDAAREPRPHDARVRDAPAPEGGVRDALVRDMFALASHLLRASNLGTFNKVAELDLSFTQIKALCTIDIDDGEPSVKGLAESMRVSLPAMSRAVDGLYVRGLVDRCEDPDDRRVKRIRLTDAGRAVTDVLGTARLLGVREFLSSLDDAGAEALGGALERILAERPEIAALRPDPEELAELPSPPQKGAGAC